MFLGMSAFLHVSYFIQLSNRMVETEISHRLHDNNALFLRIDNHISPTKLTPSILARDIAHDTLPHLHLSTANPVRISHPRLDLSSISSYQSHNLPNRE